MKNELHLEEQYAYGFHDEDVSVYKTEKGLSREVVETISKIKQEPDWMREIRLKAYDSFIEQKNPSWGPDLSGIQFDEYTYYIKPSEKQGKDWNEKYRKRSRIHLTAWASRKQKPNIWLVYRHNMNPKLSIITCWKKSRKKESFSWIRIPHCASIPIWSKNILESSCRIRIINTLH